MDMLVKLYDLPQSGAAFERPRAQGIAIRRALAPEKHKVTAWVRENFSEGWASETEVACGKAHDFKLIPWWGGLALGRPQLGSP